MKKKIGFVASMLILFMLMGGNAFFYYQHYQETHYFCQGNAVINKGGETFKARFSLTRRGPLGQLMLDGVILDNSGRSIELNRMISFHAHQDGPETYMEILNSSGYRTDSEDSELFKKVVPLFLLSDSISSRMRFFPISDHGYLITSEKFMMLYCAKDE